MNVNLLSFEELVETFTPLIKSQIKQLQRPELYDELYQISLIALWEARTQYNSKKGQFSAFAKMYVRGKLLNHINAEHKYYLRNFTIEQEIFENIPAHDYKIEVSFPFSRVLPLLSKTERIWLSEYYEHGKGPKEIAQQYNVSIDTVKTWRKRAIAKLRFNLKASEVLELIDRIRE
ncbi:MAG: sigma-70 family RNA polymerase sigma factor [Anaerobacillus sp.]|uniref:sigma-70 family RNA polymerase sigma factor n=1 Tax=Anaerobacillus sp. TaxID=1872506 RepID=UPI00391CDB8A